MFSSNNINVLEEQNQEDLQEYNYSIEELNNGIYLAEEMFMINDGFDYQMNNIIIGKDCYLVCGEYKSELSYQTRFFDSFPYLAFYQNNVLKWKIKTDFYGHGKFISGVILDDKIIVCGTFETKQQLKQIGIFEINFNGDILNCYITSGNGNSDCENVYAFNGNYYITGETDATNLGYGKVENIKHILVMVFSTKLKNFNNLYLSNDQDGKLFQTVCNNNIIYLFGEINGEGYFDNKRSNKLIFVVSERLDLDMYKQVSQEENAQLFAIYDQIIFFEYDENPSKIKVTTYGYGLNELKEQYLNIAYYVFKIKSFKVFYDEENNQILIGCTLLNNNIYYDSLTLLDDGLNILYNVEVKKEDNSILESCAIIEGELFYFGVVDQNIYGRKVMDVKVIGNECYFNGIKGEKIVKQVSENTFGTYQQEINYCYKQFLVRTFDDYIILPKCSIKDKGVYQKGVVLEFNGIGYLNNVPIESGYVITENNNYLLEVQGKDQSVFYSFVVKDLVLEEIYLENSKVEVREIIDNSIKDNNGEELYLDNSLFEDNDSFYIVLGFIFLGLILGCIIPLERIGKKDV